MSKFSTIAIIVAAGSGSRFGADIPKQYRPLGGRPVLAHSLNTLANHPKIDAVAVVIQPEHMGFYEDVLATCNLQPATLLPPIIGGKERQDSVRLALQAIAGHSPVRVLVHDAARPFVSAELIDRLLSSNEEAVVPAIEVVDTLRDLGGKTLDRAQIRRIQTPQVFDFAALKKLHDEATASVTDDAALFEQAGRKVAMVAGDPHNAKMTTLEDWKRMQAMLEAAMETRVGMGFDVHAFQEAEGRGQGTEIVICGVKIPHAKKLEGHSDADVGLHALVDALLGAMAEGDIGQHFPPSDAKWKGADSAQFVTYTRDLARQKGAVISHVDITLICEAPKVGPHREKMRARIAALLEIAPQRVSVKATTTEKLGFTGREEGIAAQAIATLKLPCVTF